MGVLCFVDVIECMVGLVGLSGDVHGGSRTSPPRIASHTVMPGTYEL